MLKRKIPLRWVSLSDGSICVWWRNKEIIIDQNDFKIFHRYYHTARPTRCLYPDGSVHVEKIPVLFKPGQRLKKIKFKMPALHSVIMSARHWQKVIHLDGNQYNCRKSNLRIWNNSNKCNWTKELIKK